MGWVEQRAERLPRACWRSEGKIVRRTCESVQEAEQVLQQEEQCSYVPAQERRAGRPRGGVRGHVPSITHYTKRKCRSAGCRSVYAEYRNGKREARRQQIQQDSSSHLHGSLEGYNLGCGCDPCKAAGHAHREATAERKRELHAERHAEAYAARLRDQRRRSKGVPAPDDHEE